MQQATGDITPQGGEKKEGRGEKKGGNMHLSILSIPNDNSLQWLDIIMM